MILGSLQGRQKRLFSMALQLLILAVLAGSSFQHLDVPKDTHLHSATCRQSSVYPGLEDPQGLKLHHSLSEAEELICANGQNPWGLMDKHGVYSIYND